MRLVDGPCLPYQTYFQGWTPRHRSVSAPELEVLRVNKAGPSLRSVVVTYRGRGVGGAVVAAGSEPELQIVG